MSILLSYSCVILFNSVFFMSTIMSDIILPLCHRLARDWIGFAHAFFHVIAIPAFVAFFPLFLVESVGPLAA
jgi:hypothetical protein